MGRGSLLLGSRSTTIRGLYTRTSGDNERYVVREKGGR